MKLTTQILRSGFYPVTRPYASPPQSYGGTIALRTGAYVYGNHHTVQDRRKNVGLDSAP